MAKFDIESVRVTVKEMNNESSEINWALLMKVSIILSLQMLLTVVVSVGFFFTKINHDLDLAVFFVSVVLLFLLMWPLFAFEKKSPINLIILSLFTLSFSVPVGLSCSFSKGNIVVEAAILTDAMVLGLTIYTFWAVKRGHDFSFLGQFHFGGSLLVIIVFSLILIFHPLGNLWFMIFNGLAAIISCGHMIYDTIQVIKEHNYDEYIQAAVPLYIDIVIIFLCLNGVLSDT